MAGPQRNVFRFPTYSEGFRGLLLREGITDELFQGGFLKACTNYHLVGRGRLLKRKGGKRHNANQPNGANAIQGLAMHDFGSTRSLVAVSGGKVVIQHTDGTWLDKTGTLTLGSGADNQCRFTQFSQGSVGSFLCGTGPGNTELWKWDGTNNAEVLGDPNSAERPPLYAKDMVEFYGRLWAINTDSGNTICQYSEDGRADVWPNENAFHSTRGSQGIGLARHNDGSLLIFHQTSIHRIEPVYESQFGDPFGRYLVDNSVGAESTYSIVTSKGVTYFASKQGFHRITDPHRPAEYIGWKIEDYWADLNQARVPNIVGFERGEPWNEVIWLVSKESAIEHDAAIVYNTELDAWSVFEQAEDTMKFNAICNYVNSDGKEITIAGGYDGYVHETWGEGQYDTGNVDDGSNVRSSIGTVLQTGAMEWGYPGLKRLREIWLDLQISDAKTFQYVVKGIADNPNISRSQNIGDSGAALGSFIFGTSALAGTDPTQAKISVNAKARLIQFKLTESDDGPPHTLNAARFWWRQSGRRIKAIS